LGLVTLLRLREIEKIKMGVITLIRELMSFVKRPEQSIRQTTFPHHRTWYLQLLSPSNKSESTIKFPSIQHSKNHHQIILAITAEKIIIMLIIFLLQNERIYSQKCLCK